MPLGIKLRVNMSHESSELENVVFQLIPMSSITHHGQVLPGYLEIYEETR